MNINRLTIKNFRCFGPVPEAIDLDFFTAFIGANGSGKSAILLALSRLFGISQAERRLQPEDFHVPHNADPGSVDKIELFIEAQIEFPELLFGDENDSGVPECFNQMVVKSEGGEPFCRVRLEGTWTRSNLPEGDIEEQAYWITTAAEEVKDEHKRPMQAYERSIIHVLYVPALRDASKQLSLASGSLVHRLLRAIEWSDKVKTTVEGSAKAIRDSVQQEDPIRHLHECLGTAWRKLHDMPTFRSVAFQPVSGALDELLKHVEAVFSPTPGGREHTLDRLSDGLKSLFYFSLVASVFQIEDAVRKRHIATSAGEATPSEGLPGQNAQLERKPDAVAAFNAERLQPPALTVFAIEEPENHLAPHYLGRIIELLTTVAHSGSGQVLLTSHSPSIMSRLDPERVRYLRLAADSLETCVRNISLPAAADEAFKYVKEAVRAYPELYFARLVILGEGDSEEIVVPRVAKALKIPIDTNLVSVVPLGGRHVNHFWKLLHGLDIPHLTLLDLDRERLGGGWGRIHYACDQLTQVGIPKHELLAVSDGQGGTRVMDDKSFGRMPQWKASSQKSMLGWMERLETYGVFFSAPLDLDFLMLRAFPSEYREAGGGSPRIPADHAELAIRVQKAVATTLKDGGTDGSTYSDEEKADFIWYSYLFLGKGKPTTHLLALNRIKPALLAKGVPPMLARLCHSMKAYLPTSA